MDPVFLKTLVSSFFDEFGLAQHHIESYNRFIQHRLPSILGKFKVVDDTNALTLDEYTIQNHYIQTPQYLDEKRNSKTLTPHLARLMNLDYTSQINVDIKETRFKLSNKKMEKKVISEKIHKNLYLCDIHVMLGSCLCVLSGNNKDTLYKYKECINDPLGYFIVNGKERTLISFERLKYNEVYTFRGASKHPYEAVAEIRSFIPGNRVIKTSIYFTKNKRVRLELPSLTEEVSVGVLFRACGVKNKADIKNLILLNCEENHTTKNIVDMIIRESEIVDTDKDAISILTQCLPMYIPQEERERHIISVLNSELFPHMGSVPMKKAYFLGYAVGKLITMVVDSSIKDDDRDHFANKRVDTAGVLFGERFSDLLRSYARTVKMFIKKQNNIETAMTKTDTISKGLKYSMGTGNWGSMKNSDNSKTGVSQVLCRLSYKSMISHLRRLMPPTGKDGNVTKLRRLHASQWGMVGPAETPEGAACGIVKNLAITTCISHFISDIHVKEYMEIKLKGMVKCFREEKTFDQFKGNKGIVFVNGEIVGTFDVKNVDEIIGSLKKARRYNILHKDTSIAWNFVDKKLILYTDGGRLLRAVFRLVDGKLPDTSTLSPSWTTLVEQNVIVYIDSSEEEWSLVASMKQVGKRLDAEYCEINPSFILSIIGATVTFPDFNQSPRNSYQAVMGKQSVGIFATNFKERIDTFSNVLCYPQKNLVSTQISKEIGLEQMSSYSNPIVAVTCFKGYGQEDALIFNRSSIQRGLFNSIHSKGHTCQERTPSSDSIEQICIPEFEIRKKSCNYGKLDERGIIRKGSYVQKGDVIVGKILVTRKGKGRKSVVESTMDCSLYIKKGEEGMVDKIFVGANCKGFRIVKVQIKQFRIPEIGDKHASLNAQKGTISAIFNQEDLPFTAQGITPDLIINPQAFPSRMTIAQLVTAILGKESCMSGKTYDASPFQNKDVQAVANELKKHGFSPTGKEVMYSGITGEMLTAQVMIAPMGYQRLKHMVRDKIHARARGPVSSFTRQPVSGRANGGGLRLGEMERDVLISHGCTSLLQERLFYASDAFTMNICSECGTSGPAGKVCRTCESGPENIKKTNVPYATKLLQAELAAVGIEMRFTSSNRR